MPVRCSPCFPFKGLFDFQRPPPPSNGLMGMDLGNKEEGNGDTCELCQVTGSRALGGTRQVGSLL